MESPMAEALSANMNEIETSKVLEAIGLEMGKYVLMSAHREGIVEDERDFQFFPLVHSLQPFGYSLFVGKRVKTKKMIQK